jgi:YHS domain-containing protein
MTRWMTGVAALALALNLAGPAAAKHKKAAAKVCPACKMTLSTKKTATNPKAVKIGGKTYYCCDKCDMSSMGSKPAGGAAK